MSTGGKDTNTDAQAASPMSRRDALKSMGALTPQGWRRGRRRERPRSPLWLA